ncbi:reverse transcriptase, partial [Globisporangium splendens]
MGQTPPQPDAAHPENNTRTDAAVREARHRAWVQRLTKIATRPWKTKPDDDLRKMVPAEEEALNAWIMGALVLDAPPAFLACTHTFLQRMAYVKFFEDCLEGTVVAVVPPRILMPEHIAEKTILMQLLASEPAGSAGYKNLCEWIQNVKRLYYTAATRRLTFIVKDQSTASKWHRREIKFRNEKLVLLSTAKLEEEDDRCDIDNVIPHQADALQYQVRVVAPGLGNDVVGQLIALSTECEVVSIARAPRARDGAYDSNFWVVIFNSEECPPQLKDVTHISAKGFSIFVHHHQRYSRIPCFQCFDPSHPKSKCTRAPGDCQMQFHRDFEPEIKQAKEMSKFELQHMSLEVRQKYIGNLSNSLGKVMANLKTKATEKALLSEMLQPADSSSSTGSAAVAAAANSATDAQSVTPSEAEWFDPANLKKQKGAMKSTISTSATTPVKSSPASKGQPHPASDAASAGRRAPKGGILKAAPKLTSVFGTSPGTVASSGSIGTGTPETSVKASNGQSNRKALQARKKRELELEAILAGKLSSADSVLDGVQANSTQAKQKIAIDARLSAAQATLDIAKEHLSKASSAHTAAAAAAATAKRKFHDVSAKAHSFALDRDEHKEADTSGRDEESSSANHEAGQFQRQIELLDLQQRVTAKEAAAASLILQEAKNAKNRAKRQLDLLKKRAKAKNLGPKDGDQHAGNKASTTAASGSSPAENTESQGDQDLAYTKLREFVKAHVVREHSPTAQTQDEEQSRTSQPGSKSFPSASRDNGSANQQPSSEPSADTTSGYSEDPSHFDVTMSLADSTSMDSTMHLQDLTGGAVTPPNGQATLPSASRGNGPPSMNQPTPGSADQDFGHIDSAESRDADPTSVFGPGPEINAAMGSGLVTGSTDDEHRFQEPEREPDSHSHTLNRPRARKIPELASSVLKAAASTTPGQSEASQESTFSNDSESGEFETPPSSPSHSVQDDGQARKSLVERLVGSKEELEQLTAAEQALRRQHFRANNKAMHDWTTATRQNRRFSLPSVDPSDVSKLTGWIPSHVDALSALICALPFPLEVLRMFPVKKLLDFGHSINSQAQRALIRHHSADDAVSAQVRAFCKKWASAVDACPQGSARWSMTDNIKQWNRLEKLDDSLLTATVSRPIDPDKWAILNVISLLLPSMFPKHEAVGHVMPETRAEEYWPAQSELKAPMVPQLALYLVAVQCEQGEMAQLSLRRKYSVEYKAYQRIPAMDYRCDHINPQPKLVVTTTDPEGANVMGFSKSDANLNAWFSHFRQTDDSGSLDIVFLQETHVLETEVASMQSRFRRSWGFQEPSEESDPRLSLWSASTERKGGVAILLNPYSCIPTLAPYKQDQWNAHWMAATVTLRGETVLLLNIYAPSTVFAREAFYRALSGLLSSHDGPILCGGDFNCTLNQMADRSHNTHNKVHDSRELKKLLQKLNLVDTLEDDALRATDTRDVKAFHRQHHTYYYTLPSGDSASSRLDQWYCSNDHLDWVRSVYQSVAGPFSDHNGVTIRVAAPDKVIQSKKPRVVYPLPKNAAALAASIGKDFFEKAHDQLDELRGRYSSPRDYALATANWWDEAKIALRIGYLEAKKSYFARLNQGYKKKIQRLQRRLSESEVQMLDHSGGAVGDHNVELSQEFLTTATSIRRAIAECKSKWQASKRDRIFREHMHHERKTSKSFYKRISTKFLDNTIFTLGGTATYGPMRSRELADDMGEGWKTIMQQAPTLQTDIDQILDPGTAIPPSDRLGFLLKPIDSSEIKQAVKKCKRGKAHGPDELGNDWASNPNYDRCAIGCATAGHSDPAMSRAIALLLDFAKAYDSLDRSFLAQALQHLGFPLKFVHLVKVLHSQTTYKFIVNGFLSRKYNVTSGIRQGCPLAPLLFILALEVLYRKIEESDEIRGVELQAAGCATEVRLGGYADDTTIYLSDPKDISAVPTEESVSDIHVLQREEHCRYLGIQVGQTPSNASNWSKCIQALRVRLRLARLKTHSVAQRAAIASAVIIPKVLYVARHSWPSTAIVNQLHDLVKQFVWGSRNGKPAKPWMKEEQAELKKMNGGLSVPNIRTELMTMSATAVSKWAITTSHIDQVIGEILLHNTRASSTYITPLDAIPRRPLQLRDNMWTTGAALCASLHSRPYEPRERDNVRWCYEHFKSTIVQTQWDGDVFQIDLSSKMSDRLPGIIAEGRKLRGTFCAEWLPYMTSTADGWLLDSNGSPYKLAHTSLSVGTAQLGDILRWEWIRPGVLNFIPTCGISGFSRPSIRALERLCATLVSNFPQLLYRPQQTNVLRLYNGQHHYNHEWHLHTSEATLTHVDTTLVKATHTVHSATDCDVMATRDLNGQKVSFHAHPLVQSSVQHLFWECPKAKLVWNYFYALWAKIGITPGHDPAIWIFSLDLPDTPRRAWTTIKRHIIGHKFSNEHQDHLYSVAHMLWRYMSASLIHAIWCAHLRRMDSDPIESTAEMAIMMTRLEAGMRNLTRLAEAQAGDSDGHTVAAVLKAYVDCFLSQTDAIPLTPNDTRGVYLLFFDGGSRGNPGPGGTGSIIVRVHKDSHTASLIWAASMAYSRKDTTNNFAEYWGLIHGLREAQRSHFEPLYVIGDSALIISQQRMHRSPRQHRLARLYLTSRRLADCIDIRGWYHHYRAFNKMADSAANLAMDTRTSTQVHFPTQRAAFNNLTQDLDNDIKIKDNVVKELGHCEICGLPHRLRNTKPQDSSKNQSRASVPSFSNQLFSEFRPMTEPPPEQPPDGGGTNSACPGWDPHRVEEIKRGMMGQTPPQPDAAHPERHSPIFQVKHKRSSSSLSGPVWAGPSLGENPSFLEALGCPLPRSLERGEYTELSIRAFIKSDKRMLSPEVSMTNMEQPKEGAARKEAPEGVSTKTATALRSGRAQVDADLAVRASQHEEGGALDSVHTNDTAQLKAGGQEKIRTIEEGTTPSRAEGSRKEASTETTPVERYEALAAKLRVSPNAVNKVEIEYEVRLMFTALYNGMRILEKPKKANDNYPTLNGEEADALVDLFRLLAIEKGKSFPEWKRTIQDLCKDMHRSSWTVVALIQKRIDQNKLAEETKASPWGSQTSTNSQTKAKEQGTQPFTFKSDKYSEEEQCNMIRHFKQKFEYSVTLRQPTTMEWEIMLAIVEGELLIRHLPQFLRREHSDEMEQNGDPLPTPIGAAHIRTPDGDNRRATGGKQRLEQAIGSGRATECRIEIQVQNSFLNTARSMNMALFLEYLKQTTGKRFYAYPLDQYGPRSNQSQWWEVLFEDELCPKALIDVRRIIWRGRTIILHHASKYRIAPCLICGAAGHFARACDVIVSKLPRKPATFTSAAEIKESVSDSIDKEKQPLQPAAESPQASEETKPSENTNSVTPDETNTSNPQPNYNPRNLTKNASFTVGTGIPVQQTGNLKEQAKAKPNGGAANTKGYAPKTSQKNGPRQISKEDIRWAKELMRFRRDMDELMKVHVERQAELNPNRNDIMDWDGEYTLQDVMDANGLAEATTPPTGNCQFYAVAEAMLQITHDNMANEKLLEATASRIKQSMNAAARLNFDLEFPEGTHLGILEALGRGDRKMSPKERKADVLDYFNDIASSSSSRSSTLPGSMWGGPESLRMAAKALQRKVFVLIETTYRNRKGFAIYKPQSRVHAGGQFLSAKEHACTGKQWEDELRQDRIEAEATSSPLPIVMKFAKEHYNSLHFRTLNEPSSPANMTSSSLAKHLQGSERSKTEFKTDRSGQFDFEPVAEDSMEESDNSSLEDLEVAPSLDEREKFEPNQLSGHHGWSFASQENQLVVYHSPTTELPPQPRKRDRDETLMLTAEDGDDAMNLNSPNVPLKKTRTLSRRLAIEGDSMQKRRDLERTLQEHWEGFQEQWKQETKCPFPLLSSNHDVWTQAALNEWERILAMLKTSPGPHHVLNHLRGPTLVDLTQVLREQVIEEGLKRLLYRTDEAETKVWITGWFDRIATATTKQQRAALLNSKEDWSTLGRMKYGGLEVLRLCHPTQQEKLSRYIICTVVYEEELQTFRSSDAEDPDNLYEAIEDFCAMLKQTRELKAAFKSGEELSEWSALSVIMAQVTMEVDSVEPSRY